MTNEEAVIVDLKCIMNCLISEDLCSIEPIEKAINSIQENTKLKAEIEQLKATISKMETTTAHEDDLKQCYSCEFAKGRAKRENSICVSGKIGGKWKI